MLVATRIPKPKSSDATGLSRGVSRLLLARNVNLHGPRPWHPGLLLVMVDVATSVRLHGTSPWHLSELLRKATRYCTSSRSETPATVGSSKNARIGRLTPSVA